MQEGAISASHDAPVEAISVNGGREGGPEV